MLVRVMRDKMRSVDDATRNRRLQATQLLLRRTLRAQIFADLT